MSHDYSATVHWGDGITSHLQVAGTGVLTLEASHTYRVAGAYKFTVKIVDDDDGATLVLSNKATVGRARRRTIIVNSALGGTDPTNSSTVTLEDAVALVDAGLGPTTIDFDPTVFATHQTIVPNEELDITSLAATRIVGPGAGVTIMDAGLANGPGSNLNLSNVTVSGGSGIDNTGTLKAAGLTISNNTSSPYGGGILNSGRLILTGSTIADNNSSRNGAGGGIDNVGAATLRDCTISGNTASDAGGGIYNAGTLNIINCTITANSTDGSDPVGGGGIANNGVETLSDCTITGNAASLGGGIYNGTQLARLGTTTITNTIVAGNNRAGIGQNPGADVYGSIKSRGFNLIGQTDGSSGWLNTDLTGTSANPLAAKLGPLANNGGPTLTELPQPGSPAINHGSVARIAPGIKTDQRGRPRANHRKVDIGSVEL